MPLIVWLGSAAIAASLPIAWWATTAGQGTSRLVRHNLTDRPTMRQATLQGSAAERVLLPSLRTIGVRLLRFTPAGWLEGKTQAIAKAGLTGRITAEQVLGAKLLLPLALAATLGLRLIGDANLGRLLVTAAALASAFVMPDVFVRAKADRRAEAITMALPDVLDQLTVAVEAGLGFEAALARTTRTGDDALSQEFGRMLQDLRLGTSRTEALESLARRSQVGDLRTVVLALRQADALGVPLARSLRAVSLDMREKRRFRAEEKAHRLPVVMIFPLGLCILPALFVVMLGPAMIRIMQVF